MATMKQKIAFLSLSFSLELRLKMISRSHSQSKAVGKLYQQSGNANLSLMVLQSGQHVCLSPINAVWATHLEALDTALSSKVRKSSLKLFIIVAVA